MSRPAFTVRGLMAAVAVAAAFFAAVRSEGSPAAGVAITVACVAVLTYLRSAEAITLLARGGRRPRPIHKAGLILSSALTAAAIVCLSDLAFLAGYSCYWSYILINAHPHLIPKSHLWPWGVAIGDPSPWSASIGLVLALGVASFLRWTIWPIWELTLTRPTAEVPSRGARR